MRHTAIRTPTFPLFATVGLLAVLAWAMTAQASGPQENPPGLDDAQLATVWNPGVVTYTFDLDNMGWRSRDIYGDLGPAPWANGRISQRFTNRGGTEPENFAKFESPRLDPALSGTGGSISFTHNKSGTMVGQVLFSVCLRFSSPGVIPPGTLPCTPWRAVSPGAVTIPLTTAGEWGVYDYISIPFYPPYTGTPLTQEQLAAILQAFRYIDIHYITMTSLCPFPQTSCLTEADMALDDVRLEITAVNGKLGASTRFAMDEDSVLFYAAVKDSNGQPIRSSNEVTMTLTGQANPLPMGDQGTAGDLDRSDGVYSRWQSLSGEGIKRATLYYQGNELDSFDVTVTPHPRLVALTNIQGLYQGFLDTGMPPGQDDDGDGEIDYYQMLGRLADYAARYRGIVYDVRENIDTLHGFPVNYSGLLFAGNDAATNRIRMASLIDEALTRMHNASQHTIGVVALVGADDVIPFYRIRDTSGRTIGLAPGIDTPTAVDLAAGYLVTDVPYGTVDYVNQPAVTRPSPQIPVGRVTAGIPMGMIERLDAYAEPVVLDPRTASAALFVPADDSVHWDWFDQNLWTPILTSHYSLRDFRTAPPFQPGYYRYNGALVRWGPGDVLTALGSTGLTVLTTHGDNRCDDTMQTNPICGTDYSTLALAGGRLVVVEASLSGFSPAFYSPTGNHGAFNAAIPRWLQNAHRTQVGTSWLAVGYNETNGLTDRLMSNFVAQALDDSNATVGDAFVHAWDGYWTSTGGDTPIGRSASYSMILWGLPTQPIRHVQPSVAQVTTAAGEGAAQTGSTGSMPALDRSFTVEVSVPNFRVDADPTGALLVRPANGGATYAEGPDLPLMPQIVKSFALPPGASDIQVTEDTTARLIQPYGPAQLQMARLHVDCGASCIIGDSATGAALPDTYPSRAFNIEIQPRPDATILILAAVPAQYASDNQLTLFTRMRFTINYKLPAAPATAIAGLTVNNGQPVAAGATAVPLLVNVTSNASRPVTITYTLEDPSGLSLGGGQGTTTLPAGAGQIYLSLNASRWPPGPKLLSVRVASANGTLDAASASIQVLGLRVEAGLGRTRVPIAAAVSLTVRAWDETGAPASGLASRMTVQVDGAARVVTFAEGPTGRYVAVLDTTGLAVASHQVTVIAADSRGLHGETWTGFVTVRAAYLPLVHLP